MNDCRHSRAASQQLFGQGRFATIAGPVIIVLLALGNAEHEMKVK